MPDEPCRILGYKYKQPGETVPAGRWGVDFANDVATGETIASASITVTDAAAQDVTAILTVGSAVLSGTQVSWTFIAGADGQEYHVEIIATGTTGAVYDADFMIRVDEV